MRAIASLLIVDDEPDIVHGLRLLLERAGHDVRTATDGVEGLRAAFARTPDLVLLDVMMPTLDGWATLERLRLVSEVPVLMLTALGQDDDKVRGLREGADDYLTKPFSRPELLARVEALLRRARLARPADRSLYADARLVVDFERHEARLVGEPVELTPLEFRLLGALVQNAGQVLSHRQLIQLAWDDEHADPASVKTYIRFLRRKLGWESGDDGPLETVRGVGYRYRAA